MKKTATMKADLLSLSDSALNRMVSIKDTDYNRNVKYGSLTKKYWKNLYNAAGDTHKTISQIADAYGASYQTVRKVVDPEYAERIKAATVRYNKTYYESTGGRDYDPEYRSELIQRKREIISSDKLAHLKAL